jgi:hypothetical protein
MAAWPGAQDEPGAVVRVEHGARTWRWVDEAEWRHWSGRVVGVGTQPDPVPPPGDVGADEGVFEADVFEDDVFC